MLGTGVGSLQAHCSRTLLPLHKRVHVLGALSHSSGTVHTRLLVPVAAWVSTTWIGGGRRAVRGREGAPQKDRGWTMHLSSQSRTHANLPAQLRQHRTRVHTGLRGVLGVVHPRFELQGVSDGLSRQVEAAPPGVRHGTHSRRNGHTRAAGLVSPWGKGRQCRGTVHGKNPRVCLQLIPAGPARVTAPIRGGGEGAAGHRAALRGRGAQSAHARVQAGGPTQPGSVRGGVRTAAGCRPRCSGTASAAGRTARSPPAGSTPAPDAPALRTGGGYGGGERRVAQGGVAVNRGEPRQAGHRHARTNAMSDPTRERRSQRMQNPCLRNVRATGKAKRTHTHPWRIGRPLKRGT